MKPKDFFLEKSNGYVPEGKKEKKGFQGIVNQTPISTLQGVSLPLKKTIARRLCPQSIPHLPTKTRWTG